MANVLTPAGGIFRRPRGGRQDAGSLPPGTCQFLSTPSARRATRRIYRQWYLQGISIHALREEGDRMQTLAFTSFLIFLSTPSARRATLLKFRAWPGQFISIHALREEGDQGQKGEHHGRYISIHALREEGDRPERPCRFPGRNFYPRPPRGGRLGCR